MIDTVPTIPSSEDNDAGLVPRQQSNMDHAEEETGGGNASKSTSRDDNSFDGESSDDDDDDDGLSDYEHLRLRNIKKNQARLAQLGLLTNTTNTTPGRASSSELTNLLTSNNASGTRQPRKKKQTVPIPQRSLPSRLCRTKLKQGVGYNDTLNGDVEGGDSGESLSVSHCPKKRNSAVLDYEDDSP